MSISKKTTIEPENGRNAPTKKHFNPENGGKATGKNHFWRPFKKNRNYHGGLLPAQHTRHYRSCEKPTFSQIIQPLFGD
jgi:hypothetical protein